MLSSAQTSDLLFFFESFENDSNHVETDPKALLLKTPDLTGMRDSEGAGYLLYVG